MPHTVYVPGKKVPQGAYLAFVPSPLPPSLEWTPRLVSLLSVADRVIGRLAGEGGRLPNPHVLIRPFVQREAVLSSKIEGTQATLGELLASEAGGVVERSPEDLREVSNYVVALEHGITRLKRLPIGVRLMRELHEKLMKNVRGEHASPGQFRKIQNWIGLPGSTLATASYIPPPPREVGPCLMAWEKFVSESDLPPLVTIALAHYQFEAIHPFRDGNGRVDALSRAMRINHLLAQWQKAVSGESSKAPLRVVELLGANPFITIKGAAEKLEVAFTTAQRAIERLERASILKPVGDAKRDRVYCAQALLGVLEEPAKL